MIVIRERNMPTLTRFTIFLLLACSVGIAVACGVQETPPPTFDPTATVAAVSEASPTETPQPASSPTPIPTIDETTPSPAGGVYNFPAPDDAELVQASVCETVQEIPRRPTGKFNFGDNDYFAFFETDKGSIKARLFQERAPIYVENFVSLACSKFYDGTVFHRVLPNFVSQGGDPTATGAGGPGYDFADVVTDSELKHSVPGVLSMANSGVHTNGSQFFITHIATPHLDMHNPDGSVKFCERPDVSCHGVFGFVYEGLENAISLEVGDALVSVQIMTRPRQFESVQAGPTPFDGPFPAGADLTEATICNELPADIEPEGGVVDFSVLDYVAEIRTSKGNIRAVLFDDLVPLPVENFITRACRGFYTGTKFLPVNPNWFALGGAMGSGIEEYPLQEQFANDLNYDRAGVMAMANIPNPSVTENGEFFIMMTPAPYLDSSYLNGNPKTCTMSMESCHPIFAYIYEGEDVYRSIEEDDQIDSVAIYSYEPL